MKGAPFCIDGLHVYVMAPVAVSETVRPRQMLLLGFEIERTGAPVFTVTEILFCAVQLAVLVPMIEYVWLLVGLTTIIELVVFPVLHVNVTALVLSERLLP